MSTPIKLNNEHRQETDKKDYMNMIDNATDRRIFELCKGYDIHVNKRQAVARLL